MGAAQPTTASSALKRAVASVKGWAGHAKGLKERFETTRPGRMVARYGDANGNVLAGGIAYYSLTSIAAGAVLGAAIASFVIGSNDAWRDSTYEFLANALPGVVKSPNGDGGLIEQGSLDPSVGTGVFGVIALVFLMFSASRYMGGLRAGVRSMLGSDARSPVTGKLRDLIAVVALMVIVILGAVLQVGSSAASRWIAAALADGPVSEWVVRGPALGAGFLTDVLFVAVVLQVLGRSRAGWRALVPTLVVAALIIGLLRAGVSLVVGGTVENPVLAPFAAVITLLVFVDMVNRVLLFAAAWLGTAPGRRQPKLKGHKQA